jgi:hypothetical protein
MSNSKDKSYLNRLDELTEELRQLRIDFNTKSNRIINDINELREEITESQEDTDTEEEDDFTFELGNYVEITNNYQGLKGTRGFIARITDKQVTLQDERTKYFHKRSKANVRKIVSKNRRQHR